MPLDCFMIISSNNPLAASGSYHVGGSNDSRTSVNKKIELSSFQHGLKQIGEEPGGRPRSVEQVEHGEFVVTKNVDAHSPKLFEICAAAIYVGRVEVLLFDGSLKKDASGKVVQQEPYLAYTMKGVHVATYSVDSADGVPVETIGLKYGSIAIGWKGANSGGNIHEDSKGVHSFGWSNMFDWG
jgi:type VI secretion system secreted protein Hcp